LTAVDPNAIGVSVAALVGSLAAAGAAVAVTGYFLGFLRTEGLERDRIFSEFRDYHAESQKKFQDQLDRLADRSDRYLATFRDDLAFQRRLYREAMERAEGRRDREPDSEMIDFERLLLAADREYRNP
jgi:hypothetical protein